MVAELFVRALKHSVFFFKKTDILTSDTWCIAIDFNLSTYHEIISIVKADIFTVKQQRQELTSISDVKYIEILLQALESKIYDSHHSLPRLVR